MKAIKCKVCLEEFSKYKCPHCKTEYCSVKCYKTHKGECTFQTETAVITYRPKNPDRNSDVVLEEDEERDRLAPDVLETLKDSDSLKDLLKNPHLKNLIVNLDSSQDKGEVLSKLMKEPIFVEFADECLQIVG